MMRMRIIAGLNRKVEIGKNDENIGRFKYFRRDEMVRNSFRFHFDGVDFYNVFCSKGNFGEFDYFYDWLSDEGAVAHLGDCTLYVRKYGDGTQVALSIINKSETKRNVVISKLDRMFKDG